MTALITKTWFEDGVLHSQKIEANGIYKKEWVVLTDAEYEAMAEKYVTNCYFDTLKYAQAIEAKIKEKNT